MFLTRCHKALLIAALGHAEVGSKILQLKAARLQNHEDEPR